MLITRHRTLLFAGLLAATTLPFAIGYADDKPPPPPPGHGPHHRPPPEALAACKEQSEGATCSFAMHDHDITGTCSHGPDGNGPLACKPAHPPSPPPDEKPPEKT